MFWSAYDGGMRTTLDIDDAVLRAARALADQRGVSLGTAVSELALRGLRPAAPTPPMEGFPVFAPRNPEHVVTADLIAEHRDD